MNIILVLIPLSLAVLVGGIAAFFWAVEHAQFEDLESPGLAPLFTDRAVPPAVVADAPFDDGPA